MLMKFLCSNAHARQCNTRELLCIFGHHPALWVGLGTASGEVESYRSSGAFWSHEVFQISRQILAFTDTTVQNTSEKTWLSEFECTSWCRHMINNRRVNEYPRAYVSWVAYKPFPSWLMCSELESYSDSGGRAALYQQEVNYAWIDIL